LALHAPNENVSGHRNRVRKLKMVLIVVLKWAHRWRGVDSGVAPQTRMDKDQTPLSMPL
jgi:hypothetical protein